MGLEDMTPQRSPRRNGEEWVEQPHQVHMRYIKEHLRGRNISWNQFGGYINSPDYPLSGSRKQKLEQTAVALDKDPGFIDTVLKHMEGK